VVQRNRGLQNSRFLGITSFLDRRTWSRQVAGSYANRGAGRAAQSLHRLAKAKLFGKHDELEHVATDTTSEAPPGPGGGEHMQIWATAVCVKRTPADERAPLPFEFDSIPSDNIFDRVGTLQRSGVNPSCSSSPTRQDCGIVGDFR
jgi:hypothetical protein